jgi:Cof subfamily protein (haloacid dehalogenase superfamily)
VNRHYKIICTDIDGTLLGKDRELSPATIQAIKRIKKDIPVILVSSRMPKAMRHLQAILGIEHYPIIAYNGGLVIINDHDGAPFLSISVSVEVSRAIFLQTQNTSIHTSLYLHDDWFVQDLDYWALREINNTKVHPVVTDFVPLITSWENDGLGPHKIMCMGPEAEIHALELFLQTGFNDQLNIYRSKPTYLELSSKRVSKATAIEQLLQQQMGFQLSEVIAFGDNYNDIEMLAAAGLGIAMANGNDALKSIADEITLSNLEDGVAVSIQKYF